LETFAKSHDIERQRREFQSSLRGLTTKRIQANA
jgi:hypothetical protein